MKRLICVVVVWAGLGTGCGWEEAKEQVAKEKASRPKPTCELAAARAKELRELGGKPGKDAHDQLLADCKNTNWTHNVVECFTYDLPDYADHCNVILAQMRKDQVSSPTVEARIAIASEIQAKRKTTTVSSGPEGRTIRFSNDKCHLPGLNGLIRVNMKRIAPVGFKRAECVEGEKVFFNKGLWDKPVPDGPASAENRIRKALSLRHLSDEVVAFGESADIFRLVSPTCIKEYLVTFKESYGAELKALGFVRMECFDGKKVIAKKKL